MRIDYVGDNFSVFLESVPPRGVVVDQALGHISLCSSFIVCKVYLEVCS